ncbi:Aldo/keto reductase family, partial [Geosmithia morbida]
NLNPTKSPKTVEFALKHGYRHIDTAAAYDNEEEVGAGFKASEVPRSEIFLTSKLSSTHHAAADVEEAVGQSLSDLGTDYLDLYLIHWPIAFSEPADPKLRAPIDPADSGIHVVDAPVEETWEALEEVVAKGKVRSIGVSNFTREVSESLIKVANIRPAVNQVEAHPYLQQPSLLSWCEDQGINVTAYSPSGNNVYGFHKPLNDPVVVESVTPSRIEENFVDFQLPADAMDRIDVLDRNHRHNLPARLGVDIFGEVGREAAWKGRADWIAAQKK